MRQQTPARSTTLPSSGHQGEDTEAHQVRGIEFRRPSDMRSIPLPPHRASPLQVKTGTRDSPHPQQSLLNSPNLPHVLMPTTLQPAL